jgi:hypothetical protein
MELYTIKDLTEERMYFNARGGAYQNKSMAIKKMNCLRAKYPTHIIYLVTFVPITLSPPCYTVTGGNKTWSL